MQSTETEPVAPPPDPGSGGSASAGRGGRLVPGLALAAGAAVVAVGVNRLVPTLSALLVAILLGVLAANVVRLPAAVQPGLAVAGKKLLRAGIVLLGLQLSLSDIVALGPGVIGVVVAVVVGGFTVAELLGRRLGLSPARRLLIGAGTSICGAAAVAAVDGAVEDSREEDVVTAIALVVVFGTLMIPLVPALGHVLDLSPQANGWWAGASIHEVAQVVAAGGIIGAAALKGAVVVKLARVLMLAPVIAIIGLRERRAGRTTGARPPIVPLFVLGFLAASVLRTTGLLPASVLDVGAIAQTFLLAAAMFALGCGVRMATLRAVGGRPVVLAAATTLTVAAIGLAGVLVVT